LSRRFCYGSCCDHEDTLAESAVQVLLAMAVFWVLMWLIMFYG